MLARVYVTGLWAGRLQVWELYRYRNGQVITQGAAFAYEARLLCAALPHCTNNTAPVALLLQAIQGALQACLIYACNAALEEVAFRYIETLKQELLGASQTW